MAFEAGGRASDRIHATSQRPLLTLSLTRQRRGGSQRMSAPQADVRTQRAVQPRGYQPSRMAAVEGGGAPAVWRSSGFGPDSLDAA